MDLNEHIFDIVIYLDGIVKIADSETGCGNFTKELNNLNGIGYTKYYICIGIYKLV